jgi:hypothetical protein
MLDTEIVAIQEITEQSIDRFRQEQWQRMAARHIDGDGCKLGDRGAFMAAQAGAEAFLERARWAFPIAAEVMGEVADAMGWPWVIPLRWKWLNFWSAEYLMGYATGRTCPVNGQEGKHEVSTYTASVSIDVWGQDHAYEPDWVPELSLGFPDHYEYLELTEEMVSDERAFREACAAAIVKAYREYALSDGFVPPM